MTVKFKSTHTHTGQLFLLFCFALPHTSSPASPRLAPCLSRGCLDHFSLGSPPLAPLAPTASCRWEFCE